MGIEPHPLTIYKSPSGTDTFAVFLDIDSFVDDQSQLHRFVAVVNLSRLFNQNIVNHNYEIPQSQTCTGGGPGPNNYIVRFIELVSST